MATSSGEAGSSVETTSSKQKKPTLPLQIPRCHPFDSVFSTWTRTSPLLNGSKPSASSGGPHSAWKQRMERRLISCADPGQMRLWRVSLIKRVVLLEQTGASIARARLKRNPQQDKNLPFAMMEEFQGGRRVASHNRNSVPLQSNKAVG